MVHAAACFLCLSCKLAGLEELAREQAACLAQFVRGMGAEKLGSQVADGVCHNWCYMVGIHMKLDFFNSTVTEMICLNNAF